MTEHKKYRNRSLTGSTMVDLPVALWLLFLGFTFPMVDFATVAMRATFFTSAARDAVHAAARSATYKTNISASNISAINAAQAAVNQDAAAFTGMTITGVNTYIQVTNINTQVTTSYSTPLPSSADTSTYVYELQTVVTGTVSPLIPFKGWLVHIPGLTDPITLNVAAEEFSEYPQGLNQ